MTRVVAMAVAVMLLAAGGVRGATLAGTVRVHGTPARDAVVYLERVDGPVAHAEPKPVVMDQKNLAFAPRVLPVVRGTTVSFTNSDELQHNVFSPSHVAGAFDLGTYSRGEVRTVTMREEGDVLVLCNIHMEMEAHILVVRDPFFAVTDGDGRYRIADVPPGRYAVKLWSRSWLPGAPTVDVPDAPEAALDVER